MTYPAIKSELDRRLRLWSQLKALGGPDLVEPRLIKQLGIHRGQQGIFRNAEETSVITGTSAGITIGILHTGRVYADDLSDNQLVYHYPVTDRRGRDANEIAATKACRELAVPLFVVLTPPENPRLRNVRLGWVQQDNDEAGEILITFSQDQQPPPEPEYDSDSTPFTLKTERTFRYSRTKTRPNQALFRFRVTRHYGLNCAVCDIRQKELLDAAHLCSVEAGGSDDPRNGLVFCLTHHRAFDRGLFGINPNTLEVAIKPSIRSLLDLSITKNSLRHLRRLPQKEALEWAWTQKAGQSR